MTLSVVEEMQEFHWLMDMIQTVDVGIVVLDRDFTIQVWNDFMESHSGVIADNVKGQSLFSVNPDIDEKWFSDKCKAVFDLRVRTFMTWEQRAYLFKFTHFHPITGLEDFMYQNIVLSPLISTTGKVDYISMMVYDVTEKAAAKKRLEALQVKLDELQPTHA
jgi:PAS domain-containing protein